MVVLYLNIFLIFKFCTYIAEDKQDEQDNFI